MKNTSQNQELFQYYNERAPEYEDFYRGKFTTKIPDSAIYKNDASNIQKLLPSLVSGKCIDIACGTGFWLPIYEKKCSRIILIDQSEDVLAECAKKIEKLGIEKKTEVIRGDIFITAFPQHEYDSAVIGFLISHLRENELDSLFNNLKTSLKHKGKFLIIDSVWSKEIIAMGREKEGVTKRSLKDGHEFNIYKRYFDKPDLRTLADKYSFKLDIIYWGKVFFMTAGTLL
ncbi:MAG: class I SAM-dependent methyltransferase [Dehalococcoidales bacterium]|nr:class I SAM-dependent methyltransferase [Dehalococcoidales bacterium]